MGLLRECKALCISSVFYQDYDMQMMKIILENIKVMIVIVIKTYCGGTYGCKPGLEKETSSLSKECPL